MQNPEIGDFEIKNFSYNLCLSTFSGLGEGVTFPVMHAMLANWSPPLELSRLNTFVYTGSTLGTIISMPLTGIICDYLGWEAAFYIFGSCGIVWFIFWALLVYEAPETLVTIKIHKLYHFYF